MVVRRIRPEDVSAIHTINTECLTRSLRERYSDEQLAVLAFPPNTRRLSKGVRLGNSTSLRSDKA